MLNAPIVVVALAALVGWATVAWWLFSAHYTPRSTRREDPWVEAANDQDLALAVAQVDPPSPQAAEAARGRFDLDAAALDLLHSEPPPLQEGANAGPAAPETCHPFVGVWELDELDERRNIRGGF